MPREDLFTPIHNAMRSVIYDTGRDLQTTDFTDREATQKVCSKMEKDIKRGLSSCMLCYLSSHAEDESTKVFNVMRSYEPEMVDMLLKEHEEIEREIDQVMQISDQLKQLSDSEERILKGKELNRVANNLFGYYITHMNKEEVTILPATQKYLTDEQLAAIRTSIVRDKPPDQAAKEVGWVIRSMNINEMRDVLLGMKKTMPPPAFEGMLKLAEQNLGKEKWETFKPKLGLE
jgi:hemerythrin HHE cation binding domain-containing protein